MFRKKEDNTFDMDQVCDRVCTELISSWVARELSMMSDSFRLELLSDNLKHIYANNDDGQLLRSEFSLNTDSATSDKYQSISRLHDLMVELQLQLPLSWVMRQYTAHQQILIDLGYAVDVDFPIGWLLHRIQYYIRYNYVAGQDNSNKK